MALSAAITMQYQSNKYLRFAVLCSTSFFFFFSLFGGRVFLFGLVANLATNDS